jgi:hypothetical protein
VRLWAACISSGLLVACAGEPTRREVLVGGPRIVELSVPEAAVVHVAIPPGTAIIEGRDGDGLKAELEIRCESATGACARRAEQVRWVVDASDATVNVSAAPESMFTYRNADITTRLSVPNDRALGVRMSAGELQIRRVSGCLDVDMTAGDVNVEVPEASVRSAHLDANFGDASLITAHDAIEGTRRVLVGADVNWAEGQGTCALSVDLNFGDVEAKLY